MILWSLVVSHTYSLDYMLDKTMTKLEYSFAREKEILFAQQKQNIPVSINDFVEMTIILCLIFDPFMQKFNLPAKMWGNDFL